MSDNKNNPKPPPAPDDFSKTTPNFKVPQSDDVTHDWEKTNYNFSPQPLSDDWGNTVTNFNPNEDANDFDSTFNPSSNNPKAADWGVTQPGINVSPSDDFGASSGAGNQDYGATTPYIRLPQAERAKYQNLPPTPTEAAKQKREEEEKGKKGIPGWAWIAGGLAMMFVFAVVVLVGVYFFFITTPGFEVVVNNVPRESRITVNGTDWDVTTPNEGTRKLQNLKSGEQKKIEVTAPNYKCDAIQIEGQDGEVLNRNAECRQEVAVSNECENLKSGDYIKSQKCAEDALGKLGDQFSLDDLLKALNLAIIKFDSNSSEISEDQKGFLKIAAGYLKKVPENVVIEVGGHTDNVGGDEPNQTLSEARAKSVRDALIAEGVNEKSLSAKGYGEKNPVASNDTETGRFYNRRIEYSIAK